MDPFDTTEPVTGREREVLDLMAKGLTNGEIAAKLGIGFETAKWHVSNVIAKLGVATREEAVQAWKRRQSVAGRLSRAAQALVATPMLLKAAGLVAGGAIAAGTVAVAGIIHLGSPSDAQAPVAVEAPSATPTPTLPAPASRDYVVLSTLTAGTIEFELVVATPGGGHWLCETVRPVGAADAIQGPGDCDPPSSFEDLAWSLVFIAAGDQQSHEPRLVWGSVPPGVESVEVELPAGATRTPDLIEPAPGLATDRRFYATELPTGSSPVRLRAYAADGSAVATVTYPRRDGGLLSFLKALAGW